MMKALSVVRSLFSQESMAKLVAVQYALPAPIQCHLLQMGDNDCYRISAGSAQYVLRIYRTKYWLKSDADYLFEIDWLRYLQEKRCSVSYPIARKDGSFLGQVEAPEGPRHYVLFSFAEGTTGPLNRKRTFLLGKEIARIHLISAKFKTSHERAPLDLHFLLEEPVLAIKKHLGNTYTVEQERLDELATQLKEKILSLLAFKGNDWGLVGGDFHGFNQRFLGDNRLTLFDFDLCGYGWRAYDLAVFRWMQLSDLDVGENVFKAWIKGSFSKWKHFLSGYQSVRRLSDAELEAIPLLVQIRQIWLMGAYVRAPDPMIPLDENWWNSSFKRLFKPFQ